MKMSQRHIVLPCLRLRLRFYSTNQTVRPPKLHDHQRTMAICDRQQALTHKEEETRQQQQQQRKILFILPFRIIEMNTSVVFFHKNKHIMLS